MYITISHGPKVLSANTVFFAWLKSAYNSCTEYFWAGRHKTIFALSTFWARRQNTFLALNAFGPDIIAIGSPGIPPGIL